MTRLEFEDILAVGREQRGIEFKGPGSKTDLGYLAKVVRAVIAMANKRDGGRIFLGVNDKTLEVEGLTPAELETWKFDHVADAFASHIDPPVEFDLQRLEVDGKTILVLDVREFREIPHLCAKDFEKTLRRGAIYVRTLRKPESSEIPSQSEMRELLDLATDKALRKFLERLRSVGQLPSLMAHEAEAESPYRAEALEFFESPLAQTIRSRAYWLFTIRPLHHGVYLKKTTDFEDIVRANMVQLRGWYFPHIQPGGTVLGLNHAEQAVEWEDHIETWRFYNSGQFVFLGGIRSDWQERVTWFEPRPELPYLGVVDTIFKFTEVFEFASRLTSVLNRPESMLVSLEAHNIHGKRLWIESPARGSLYEDHTVRVPKWAWEKELSSGDLLASSKDLAIQVCQSLFQAFGWDADERTLRDIQMELRWSI